MNVAVKIFKRFAAMADHGPREGLERFRRDLDRAGGEKLVVRDHGKRSTVRAGLATRSTVEMQKVGVWHRRPTIIS